LEAQVTLKSQASAYSDALTRTLTHHLDQRGTAYQQKTRLIAGSNRIASAAYALQQELRVIDLSSRHDELRNIQKIRTAVGKKGVSHVITCESQRDAGMGPVP